MTVSEQTQPAERVLSRNVVLALVGITLAMHMAEEYIAFPLVMSSLGRQLPAWLPAPALQHSVRNLHMALIVGTVLPCMVIAWAMVSRSHGFLIASLFIEAVLLVNAIAHIFTALLRLGYVPGLITGALINLPFGIYVFRRAVRDRWVRDYRVWQMIAVAVIVHLVWMGGGILKAASAKLH